MVRKDLTDEALVELLQQDGNARFFPLLVTRYEKEIFKRCTTYIKEKETAEDLTQEILIKVYLQLPRFRKQAKFSTWLYAIIHNTCIDHLRKNANRNKIIIRQLADLTEDIPDLDEQVSVEITTQVLNQLLDQITPEDRLILLLKYQEKQSIKDIHSSLGISESAVKMRLKRAKEKVFRLINK